MQTTAKKINAMLLAGDRQASIKLHHKNKAFLNLRGVPLFIHVLKALLQSERVGEIVAVGPAEQIRKALIRQRITEGVRVVEQRENMIENFKAGYVVALGLDESTPFRELKGSEHEHTPVLTVPCDTPLLLPEEVDEFLAASNMHEYDYCIGVTSHAILSRYYPSESKPGIRMIYFHVKEDLIRQNNLHIGKPLLFEHLEYVEKMYQWRYQTRPANILHVFLFSLAHGWRLIKGLRIFILMQLSLYCDRRGYPRLSNWFRSKAPFNQLSEVIGQTIGARVQLVYTHLGGATLDADNEEDMAVIEERCDEWRALQRKALSSES